MKKISALLFFLLCRIYCFAQEPYFRHFGVEQGLPGSEVYDILQDRNGFIWIATDRGVSKYDGYSFRNFSSSDGLTDNTVFILTEDSAGNIWCATLNSRLCYFSGEKIIPFAHNAALENQAQNNSIIQSMAISASGDVLLGYQQKGCVRIDPAGKKSDLDHSKKDSTIHNEVFISGHDCIVSSSDIAAACIDKKAKTLYIDMDGKVLQLPLPPVQSSYFIRGLRKKKVIIKQSCVMTVITMYGDLSHNHAPGK